MDDSWLPGLWRSASQASPNELYFVKTRIFEHKQIEGRRIYLDVGPIRGKAMIMRIATPEVPAFACIAERHDGR